MSQEPEEEAKPKININITYEGSNITVKARMNTKFGKIFDSVEASSNGYTIHIPNLLNIVASPFEGSTPGTFKFVFEGQRIQRDDTPASVGLEDNDQIDAFLMQVGGGTYL